MIIKTVDADWLVNPSSIHALLSSVSKNLIWKVKLRRLICDTRCCHGVEQNHRPHSAQGITGDLSAGGIRLAVTGDEEQDDDLRLYLFLFPNK